MEKYLLDKSIDKFRNIIYEKLNGIVKEIDICKNINNFNLSEKFIKQFETDKIPKFLEKNIIDEIETKKLINKYVLNQEKSDIKTKKICNINEEIVNCLMVYYYQFINKEAVPFKEFDKKELFEIILYSNLNNIYNNSKFKEIFITNFYEISKILNYYEGISEFEDAVNNRKKYEWIDDKMKSIFNKYKFNEQHLNVLGSYFYLIINKENNLGNPFLIKILKNILCFFAVYCPDKIYTKETYLYLFNYFDEFTIQNGKEKKLNKEYNFENINEKINSSEDYTFKLELSDLNSKIKKIEYLGLKEPFIKLIPLTKYRASHTITILISGFLSEKDELETWSNFYNCDEEKTNYYMFKWPSSNILSFICKIMIHFIFSATSFIRCYKKAEYVGRLLALFLINNDEFNDCQINLVGFSLGCHVIINCLKELNEFKNHRFMINNVLLMGGATVIDDSEKDIWRNIILDNIGGRIINCYSNHDEVLSKLFQACIFKTPIGLKNINIKDENGNSIIENHDFSDIKLGHLQYRNNFKTILNRINFF